MKSLDEYLQAFLLNFDIRHDELQRELAQTKEDVARLRMALLEKEDFIISLDQFDDTQRTDGVVGIAAIRGKACHRVGQRQRLPYRFPKLRV